MGTAWPGNPAALHAGCLPVSLDTVKPEIYPAQPLAHDNHIGNLCLQEWQPQTMMATQKRREVERLRSGMARGRKAAKPQGCEAARLRGMPRGREAARDAARPQGCEAAREAARLRYREATMRHACEAGPQGCEAATLQAMSMRGCDAASSRGRADRAHVLRAHGAAGLQLRMRGCEAASTRAMCMHVGGCAIASTHRTEVRW